MGSGDPKLLKISISWHIWPLFAENVQENHCKNHFLCPIFLFFRGLVGGFTSLGQLSQIKPLFFYGFPHLLLNVCHYQIAFLDYQTSMERNVAPGPRAWFKKRTLNINHPSFFKWLVPNTFGLRQAAWSRVLYKTWHLHIYIALDCFRSFFIPGPMDPSACTVYYTVY